MSAVHEMNVSKISETKVFDAVAVRDMFPVLAQQVYGHPLAYLDNAATTQKPESVIQAIQSYYAHDNANIHRGVHALSERATASFEGAREKVRAFLNARSTKEIIFVRGATEAINLVASSWGQTLQAGDEILITGLEHHSNIVPWQLLAQRTGARLVVVPIEDDGSVSFEGFEAMLSERTKLTAFAHVSNALGTVNPVRKMIEAAHRAGALALVDGAQAVGHMMLDVQDLDADFYVISGHKMYAPTGTGVLYGKEALLEAMPPYQGGGDMIRVVSFEATEYNDLPYKFEAGTPNIAGVVGLGAAVDWIESIGRDAIYQWEASLLSYAQGKARNTEGLRIIGDAPEKASVLSFVLEGVHPHDLGTILDRSGIAIRAGHHCAMPVMAFFGVPATARASFAAYNTRDDIDRLFDGLDKAQKVFS